VNRKKNKYNVIAKINALNNKITKILKRLKTHLFVRNILKV